MADADTFPMEEMPRRKLSFSDSDGLGTSSNSAPERMRAYVRLRPLTGDVALSSIQTTDTDCTISIPKASAQGVGSIEEHAFTFDGVFGPEATQTAVYESVMRPQVQALLEGRDTLTFAYGITNAGKTYTVQGKPEPDQRGVLPRALASIFEALEELKRGTAAGVAAGADPSSAYDVRASFLEVYGSEAHDLLAPAEKGGAGSSWWNGGGQRRALRIKEANGKVSVEGLKEVELPDLATAIGAVEIGWSNRSAANNGINDVSSRSHAVLCLKLRVTPRGGAKPKETRLIVVDLAGAEKQKMTQSTGERLNEANAINKDLMVLGHCLRDLRWNQGHPRGTQRVPPFRNSRITMLFRDFLGGMGQTVVVAALNPRAADAQSTLETLRFASVAQQIKTRAAPAAPPPAAARQASRKKAARGSSHDETSHSDSQRESEEYAAPAYGSNEHALCEQVIALQERLQAVEVERMGDERRIREEVSAEMQKHIEETEHEMSARLDEALFSTEEAYHKKLLLVKQAQQNNSSAATAQAHEEMMQMQRLSQRREAETISRINSANAQLEASASEVARLRKELASLKAGAPSRGSSAALDEARSEIAELELQVRDAAEARKFCEASRAEAEAAADEARAAGAKAAAKAAAAEGQMVTLKESLATSQAARDEAESRRAAEEAKADGLMARLAAEVEQVAALTAKVAALRSTAAPAAPQPIPQPPALAVRDSGDLSARILSPKRGIEAAINRIAPDPACYGGESPAKKARGGARGKSALAKVVVEAPAVVEVPAVVDEVEVEVEEEEEEEEEAEEEEEGVEEEEEAEEEEEVDEVEVEVEVEEEDEAPGSLKQVSKPSKLKALRNPFKSAKPSHEMGPPAPPAAKKATKLPEPTPVSRRTRSSQRVRMA